MVQQIAIMQQPIEPLKFMIMIIPGTLREEAKRSFKKYCNNALFKDVYVRAFIRGANWAKTNKY